MGIDELGDAAVPQRDTTPLSQRSLAWWVLFMPGKVLLWFAYMFPSGVVGSFASARQRNVPIIQFAYTVGIYAFIAIFAYFIHLRVSEDERHRAEQKQTVAQQSATPRQVEAAANTSPPAKAPAAAAETRTTAERVSTKPEEESAPPEGGGVKADGYNDGDYLDNRWVEDQLTAEFRNCVSGDGKASPANLACVVAEINRKDELLNSTYKKVMSKLAADDKASLKQEERAWIFDRDAKCKPKDQHPKPDTDLRDAYASCYLARTMERLMRLDNLAAIP